LDRWLSRGSRSCSVTAGIFGEWIGVLGLHPIFEVYAETIGHTIDEVKVGSDEIGCQDLGVGEADLSERIDIVLTHLSGTQGELHRVVAQSTELGRELCVTKVEHDLIDDIAPESLVTEILSVRLGSVEALVGSTNDRSDELSFQPAERRVWTHGGR
jgi:hypothetical protein